MNLAIFLYFAWYMYRSMRVVYRQGRRLTLSKLVLLAFFYLLFAGCACSRPPVSIAFSCCEGVTHHAYPDASRAAGPCLRSPWRRSARPAPAGAEVYIISPKNGAHVHAPVLVQFGLKGMGVAPAGVKFDNTGHHHLLIDTDAPADLSAPLPANEHIVHFGKGQTETTLNLAPGKHTLQLLFADMNHVPAQPAGHVAQDHHHRGEVGARTR